MDNLTLKVIARIYTDFGEKFGVYILYVSRRLCGECFFRRRHVCGEWYEQPWT